jgi:hypothetical protein
MLTLGLMEGALTFAALTLVFVGAIEHVPMHRILGPPAIGLLVVVGYQVYHVHAVDSATEVAGLLVLATLGFLAPLAGLAVGWRVLHETQEVRERPARTTSDAPRARPGSVTVRPLARARKRARERV